MKLELTKKEYRSLLDLIFLGDWIINAYETTDDSAPNKIQYKKTIQKIYSHAKDFGFDNLILFSKEMDMYTESHEFEDSEVSEYIDEFEENMFLEKLIFLMAGRDALKKTSPEEMQELSNEERFALISQYEQKWAEEFHNHGIDRLGITEK